MAKTFYYDSGGLLEATVNDGSVSSGVSYKSFADGTTLTNEHYAVDQSISNAVTAWVQNDALSFEFSSAIRADFLALYFSSSESDDILFEYDNAATGESTGRAVEITSTLPAGWSVKEFTQTAAMAYWRLIANSAGGLNNLTEVIFGNKLAFEINPDIGMGEAEEFNTIVNTSIGGVQYGTKKGNTRTSISMNFSSISETFKDNLVSMQQEVQDYKKFLYSENSATGPFHYVRLENPIKFQEVSHERYSASISLIEQLS